MVATMITFGLRIVRKHGKGSETDSATSNVRMAEDYTEVGIAKSDRGSHNKIHSSVH